MRYAIITSRKNIASENIYQSLCRLFDFKLEGDVVRLKSANLYHFDLDMVHMEDIDKEVEGDILIFACTHKSKAGVECFCVHAPGNFSTADLGGKERKLCVAPAREIKRAYLALKRHAGGALVTLEATHHGPLVSRPCMFMEIGSSEKEWREGWRADAVAKAIMDVVNGEGDGTAAAIGFGGLHYCDSFNRVLDSGNIALGHIAPKHALASIDRDMLVQMAEKTEPKPSLAIIDWKGMGAEKDRILGLLGELGIGWKKTKELK